MKFLRHFSRRPPDGLPHHTRRRQAGTGPQAAQAGIIPVMGGRRTLYERFLDWLYPLRRGWPSPFTTPRD